MNPFTIPPLQIDLRTLPPLILTSEPGSFAYKTLAVRVPGIVDDTISTNDFPPDVRRAVQELRAEIVGGHVRPLHEDTPDRDFWNELSRTEIGHSWLDVPWYWAETYFYRRMLEATGYFKPGPLEGFDPYAAKKQTELAPEVAPRTVGDILLALGQIDGPEQDQRAARFQSLLHSSLWGNRIDLSYNVSTQVGRGGRQEDERANILIDDSARAWAHLQAKAHAHIAVLADNAGTELSMDLALIDFLLRENVADQVTLHVKPQPFFVSDAMLKDVDQAVAALGRVEGETRALADRLNAWRAEGRLALETHWYYSTCLFYFQMPEDLREELARADLVIVKGDANYRRLIGDAHWAPTASFASATRYFPAPLVALRTLKAELIVGLAEGEAERLSAVDPDWMVNGRRGVIQSRIES